MMTDLVAVAIIAAAASVLGSVASIVVSVVNRKNTKAEIQRIHVSVNSRMDELLRTAKHLSRSEGQAEGKEQEREDARIRGEK